MSGTFMLNNRNYTASGNLRLGGDVANPNIADVYDPTQAYNTGDRRIYDDVLYVCNDDNVTGAWDSTKWDSATVDEIISALTAADIPYSSGVSVADKLDSLGAVSRFSATGSVYGGFSCKAINGVKCISVNNPKGLAANALTTLDFTLPETMRPIENIRYFDIRQPNDNYTIRLIINPDGTVQIYNYGTSTGTMNMSFTGCYI